MIEKVPGNLMENHVSYPVDVYVVSDHDSGDISDDPRRIIRDFTPFFYILKYRLFTFQEYLPAHLLPETEPFHFSHLTQHVLHMIRKNKWRKSTFLIHRQEAKKKKDVFRWRVSKSNSTIYFRITVFTCPTFLSLHQVVLANLLNWCFHTTKMCQQVELISCESGPWSCS